MPEDTEATPARPADPVGTGTGSPETRRSRAESNMPDGAAQEPPLAHAHLHEHILQFFAYRHLPPHLANVSRPFCELAHALVLGDNAAEAGTCTTGAGPLPRNPERTVALRKLLEAKDAAVRALLAKV